MQFKYNVRFELASGRKVSATIRSSADFDIKDRQHLDYFAYVYDVIQVIEKMWGAGCVRMWEVTEKIPVQRSM